VANAATVGPMIIATAIKAAALDISPLIPKNSIPQLAIPNAKTAKIIAMIKPTTLISNSIAVTGLFSFSDIQIPDRAIFWIKLKTFSFSGFDINRVTKKRLILTHTHRCVRVYIAKEEISHWERHKETTKRKF
jgi:hypothetical protein